MVVTIPPPQVPFAPGSNYLLDALVPMPLPFLFLSLASSLDGGLFHLFLGLFVLLFGSSGFRHFTTLRLRQVFYALPPRHSPIATFLSSVLTRSPLQEIRVLASTKNTAKVDANSISVNFWTLIGLTL
jgi:hypothetical protein